MPTEANRPKSIVFVFLDGVGIGPEADNPLAVADMPFLDAMLDGVRPTAGHPLDRNGPGLRRFLWMPALGWRDGPRAPPGRPLS